MAYIDANIKRIIDKTAAQAAVIGTAGFTYIHNDDDLFGYQGSTYHILAEQTGTNNHSFILNKNETGSPSADVTLQIERGTSTNASILWNETADIFKIGLLGSEKTVVAMTTALTDTYIPMSDGAGLVDSILAQTARGALGYNSIDILQNIASSTTQPWFTLQDSYNVSHSFTDILPANAFLSIMRGQSTGSAIITGISNASSDSSLILRGLLNYNTAPYTEQAMVGIIGGRKAASGGGYQAIDATETLLKVSNNTTPLLTILGNGAAGYGATVPLALIHSACSLAVMAQLQLDDTRARAAGNGGQMLFGFKATTGSDVISASAAIQGAKEQNTDTDTAGELRLKTAANGGAVTTRMTVSSAGDVTVAAGDIETQTAAKGPIVKASDAATTRMRIRCNNAGFVWAEAV